MTKDVQAAVTELLADPTEITLEHVVRRVDGSTESARRMALESLERYLSENTEQVRPYVAAAVVALRRAGC